MGLGCKNYYKSQSLILPCSLATASNSEFGENAIEVILPRGVEEVGQFLYTVQDGRWTMQLLACGQTLTSLYLLSLKASLFQRLAMTRICP